MPAGAWRRHRGRGNSTRAEAQQHRRLLSCEEPPRVGRAHQVGSVRGGHIPRLALRARQLLANSSQCGLPPALAPFGQIHNSDRLKLYHKMRDGRPPIQIWWWTGYNGRR